MTINDQIRASLRNGEALNLDQLADANGWSREERSLATKRLSAMKARGEISSAVEEGRAVFSLAKGFEPNRPGRAPKPGRPIHVGRGDKTPKSPPADPIMAEGAAIARTNGAVAGIAHVAASQMLASTTRGLYGASTHGSDFDLVKRMDVVTEDVEALLSDALDTDQDKELVKQLVAANNALNRAARLYRRK